MSYEREIAFSQCTVWCSITSEEVIGSSFFENANCDAVMVNEQWYQEIFENTVCPFVRKKTEMWFQQHGPICHATETTMQI